VANNYSAIVEVLSKIEGRVTETCHFSEGLAQKIRTIQTYDEVVLAKDPRKMYSEAVDDHSKVCAQLSDISVGLIRVRTLRKSLGSGADIAPQLVNQMQVRIERMIKMLEDARTALVHLKESYDARLRFYNTCLHHI
jgi:hypothetical protein